MEFYQSNSIAASAGEVVEFPGFDDITYMQDMTDHKCYIAEVGETKQLIDSRDGKKYWVSKLADGNCWMTQNLDFDIPATLSNTTSDVNEASVETGISGSTSLADWSGGNNTSQYYDPGEKIVSDKELVDAPAEVDRHSLVGNYYSWPAATVGSGNDLAVENESAKNSICPKGWKLAIAGEVNDETSGSFYYLLNKYGLATSNVDGKITASPLYFVPAGIIANDNSADGGFAISPIGRASYCWASTIKTATNAHFLMISTTINGGIVTSTSTSHAIGMPIRCLAK